jgi:hypothetical protein
VYSSTVKEPTEVSMVTNDMVSVSIANCSVSRRRMVMQLDDYQVDKHYTSVQPLELEVT